MRRIRDIYPQHENKAAAKAFARFLRHRTEGEGSRAYDVGPYTAYANDGSEPVSPIPGVVVDPGCVMVTRDGFPCVLVTDEGCCVLSAKEPVEGILNRFLPEKWRGERGKGR